MKRTLIILTLLASTFMAGAQYNPSAELIREGGRLYQGDQKLSKEQIHLALSPFKDEKGRTYEEIWNKSKDMRTAGIVLTSVGSVSLAAGPVVTLVGAIVAVAEGLGAGLGAGLTAAFGGTPQPVDKETLKSPGIITSGFIVTGAGVAMLGSGIPLLCVGNKRMKNVVSDYNAQLPAAERPETTIAFGPCPNGIGLSLKF